MFCQCGRGETKKKAEALKGITIDTFKTCFEQWKKVSIGVLHHMEGILKVTNFKHVRTNAQFFYK